MKQASVRTYLRHLKVLFHYAESKDIIIRTPIRIKIDELKVEKRRKPYLKYNEIVHLLATAKGISRDAHLFFAVAIYTGMRLGEINRLKWKDITNLQYVDDKNLQETFAKLNDADNLTGLNPSEKNMLKVAVSAIAQMLEGGRWKTVNVLTMPYDELKVRHPRIFKMITDIAPRRGYINVMQEKTNIPKQIPIFDELKDILLVSCFPWNWTTGKLV